MSGLGSIQTKMADIERKYGTGMAVVSGNPMHLAKPSEYTPHGQARLEQEEMNRKAEELEAQQNADAAAASLGPQAMAMRAQNEGYALTAGGAAGASLYDQPRRGARRRLT